MNTITHINNINRSKRVNVGRWLIRYGQVRTYRNYTIKASGQRGSIVIVKV